MEKTRKSERLPAFVAEHLLVVATAAVLLVLAGVLTRNQIVEEPQPFDLSSPSPQTVFPDLSLAEGGSARKEMFLNFMQDYIYEQNHLIMMDRLRLLSIDETMSSGGVLPHATREWLADLASRYGVAEADFEARQAWLDELLFRVDIVPASLALAQAANESA